MRVEQFVSGCAVEALDKGILVGFSGLDVLDCHTYFFGPSDEGFAQEFGTVVRAQHLGQAALPAQLIEDPHQALQCVWRPD